MQERKKLPPAKASVRGAVLTLPPGAEIAPGDVKAAEKLLELQRLYGGPDYAWRPVVILSSSSGRYERRARWRWRRCESFAEACAAPGMFLAWFFSGGRMGHPLLVRERYWIGEPPPHELQPPEPWPIPPDNQCTRPRPELTPNRLVR